MIGDVAFGLGVPLACRFEIPGERGRSVPCDTVTMVVENTNFALTDGISLFGGSEVPFHGGFVVLLHTLAILVHVSKIHLSVLVAEIGVDRRLIKIAVSGSSGDVVE